MPLIDAVLLGLIQGLTEFLPVSSSGHLAAARILFGVSDTGGNAFDAFLHLGTLLAVLAYFRQVWWGMVRSFWARDALSRERRDLALKLAAATVPAAAAGYFWRDAADTVFRSPLVVAGGLVGTAAALALVELAAKRSAKVGGERLFGEAAGDTAVRVSLTDALVIGLVQVLALVPGVSRSGVTIAAGRVRGMTRLRAVTFSFLLSAPIIAGASLASLGALAREGSIAPTHLLIGLLVSFAAGLAAIFVLLKVVERVAFWPFVVYLLGLAGVLAWHGT